MLVIDGEEGLRAHQDTHLGVGSWRRISQADIDRFADVTGDHQWIHTDPARARESPFGGTIAHGFLTLALLPELTTDIYRVDGFTMAINYGLNRVRFPAPVPSGSRLRAAVKLRQVEAFAGGVQAEYEVVMTVEGAEKPSCVAEYVGRYYR